MLADVRRLVHFIQRPEKRVPIILTGEMILISVMKLKNKKNVKNGRLKLLNSARSKQKDDMTSWLPVKKQLMSFRPLILKLSN